MIFKISDMVQIFLASVQSYGCTLTLRSSAAVSSSLAMLTSPWFMKLSRDTVSKMETKHTKSISEPVLVDKGR